ncbi:universal stress protein [Chlorobium phaeobacteroides]|uniref:UspA domain protein n=1 Tax=Chlorobium phaeobacteroides (strain DSM 266 / SMG 266 / 2430) TaxID=290317 RepID=A1BCN8_CHLPD|nr:universal stress protein [Chlorobium phaeobacteroides]ABL64165.1 UspA domain protein [Chlorobium phaeobacteroides DSM 266]
MKTKPKKIICAVDFSPLSDNLVTYAAGLRPYDAELTLLYIEKEGKRTLNMLQNRLHAFSRYSELLVQANRSARFAVECGDPAAEILAYADRVHADLLLLGSHGSTAFTRLLMGSTAETVLRRAACPVAIYKVPDRRTPARKRQEATTLLLKDNKQTA